MQCCFNPSVFHFPYSIFQAVAYKDIAGEIAAKLRWWKCGFSMVNGWTENQVLVVDTKTAPLSKIILYHGSRHQLGRNKGTISFEWHTRCLAQLFNKNMNSLTKHLYANLTWTLYTLDHILNKFFFHLWFSFRPLSVDVQLILAGRNNYFRDTNAPPRQNCDVKTGKSGITRPIFLNYWWWRF